jgi:hypothetical protein
MMASPAKVADGFPSLLHAALAVLNTADADEKAALSFKIADSFFRGGIPIDLPVIAPQAAAVDDSTSASAPTLPSTTPAPAAATLLDSLRPPVKPARPALIVPVDPRKLPGSKKMKVRSETPTYLLVARLFVIKTLLAALTPLTRARGVLCD